MTRLFSTRRAHKKLRKETKAASVGGLFLIGQFLRSRLGLAMSKPKISRQVSSAKLILRKARQAETGLHVCEWLRFAPK